MARESLLSGWNRNCVKSRHPLTELAKALRPSEALFGEGTGGLVSQDNGLSRMTIDTSCT